MGFERANQYTGYMKERVCCLYRVSTDKQVDYNDKNQADIPMQRRKCHQFADQMGWVIVHEEQTLSFIY